MANAAAFFDLDRTLLRRSSALALAPTFRARKLISRRQLARAAAWQLMFMLRGASADTVKRPIRASYARRAGARSARTVPAGREPPWVHYTL